MHCIQAQMHRTRRQSHRKNLKLALLKHRLTPYNYLVLLMNHSDTGTRRIYALGTVLHVVTEEKSILS